MPGQDRIERMLREVWQRCRVRFEQELRPFEIALGERLNALFKDSTDWPEHWAAFVAEWHARGVLVSEPSQRAIAELLDLVAQKQPIPGDPSGRYFMPTAAAPPAPPPPSNATSPNWPALTGPQREQIQGETGLAWWYPIQPVVPGDQVWEYLLAAKARAARGKLLDFFLALQALGALADAEGEEGNDGLEAIQNQSSHVRDAHDNYIASYIALQQRWLQYLQYQPFLGMYVAGLMRKVDAGLPPSVLGLHSKYERELMEVQAEIVKASNSLSTRVDVAYTVAVWTDRAITVIEAATFFLSAGAVAKTALTKALAAGATRSAAVNLAIRAGLKQAVIQATRQLAIGTVLPEILIAAGLDEKQVRQGLVLLDAAPMLLNLRTLKVELSRSKPEALQKPATASAQEIAPVKLPGDTKPSALRSPANRNRGKPDDSADPPSNHAVSSAEPGPPGRGAGASSSVDLPHVKPEDWTELPIATDAGSTGAKDKSWRNLIEGQAQKTKTDGHRMRILREAARLAQSGNYDRIWLNRAYSTTTGTRTVPRRLPDIIARRKSGQYDVIEVPSRTNRRKLLIINNDAAMKQLPESERGTIRIIEINEESR